MFSLIDECGEINFVEFNIDTESPPIKQASHRAPYAVQQEIAAQVSKMQNRGEKQLSKSLWASQ